MITFSDLAKEKVNFFLKSSLAGTTLRITVIERNKDGFQYHFGLDPYGNLRPNDVIVNEGGFVTRIDPESAKWLNGASVDWLAKDGKEGFAVANPNQPVKTGSNEDLKDTIITELKSIFDPEIPVNIYDLGLIYNIDIKEDKSVEVTMTLTAPNCPAAEQLPADVKTKVEGVSGIKSANVTITWEPVWTPANMSEAAKLELNIS